MASDRYYVYLFRDPRTATPGIGNGEPYYVGKGKNNRFKQHLLPRGGQNKQVNGRIRLLREAGYSTIQIADHITVSECATEQEALELEKKLIKIFGRKDQGTGTLFNHTDGGEGISGYRHTKETKLKMSKIQMGHSPTNTGPPSKATREKISKALKGRSAPWRKGAGTSEKQKTAVRAANLRRKGIKLTGEALLNVQRAVSESNKRRCKS